MLTSRHSISPSRQLRVRATNFVAINKFHTALAQLPADFAAALKMPRHQHQKQFRKLRAQPLRDFRQNDFLAVVRAAADQNRRVRRHAELPQQRRHVERAAFVQFRRVKFQIADDVDGFGPAADFAQPLGVLLVLAPTPANEANSGRNRKPNRL